MTDVAPKGFEILQAYSMAHSLQDILKRQSYAEHKAEFRRLTTKLTDIVSVNVYSVAFD